MSTAKINIKNIDYFKFKKIVIDGNRDDYNNCSKEVKSLCDCVQTLTFRDEEFDVQTDRARFEEICSLYRQILASKRIEALDMRLKSGWWSGGPSSSSDKASYSAGKIKASALLDTLAYKTREWKARHSGGQNTQSPSKSGGEEKALEGPGFFVLKHREHQCYQRVERAENIFQKCGEILKGAFEGNPQPGNEPLSALIIISSAADWDFYFIPFSASDNERFLRIIENDLLLKHDSIWPRGLNFSLRIDSLLEVSEFRRSCVRHRWPPEAERGAAPPGSPPTLPPLDLKQLRAQVESGDTGLISPSSSSSSNIGDCSSEANTSQLSSKSKTAPVRPTTPKAARSQPPVNTETPKRPKTPQQPENHHPAPAPPRAATSRPSSAVAPKSTHEGKPAAALKAVAKAKAQRNNSPSDAKVERSPRNSNVNIQQVGNNNQSPEEEKTGQSNGQGPQGEEDDLQPAPRLTRSNTFTYSDTEE